jgi:hypothetical protein
LHGKPMHIRDFSLLSYRQSNVLLLAIAMNVGDRLGDDVKLEELPKELSRYLDWTRTKSWSFSVSRTL